jgi:tRNA-2-methylthio-N6-dimethylallyladenosine synthase
MNVHDTSRIEEVLRPHGFSPTPTPEQADLIIVNTCSVREKSREKVLSTLGRLAPLKQPGALLAVAGCVAQQEGRRLLELAPAVDLVFSPDHIRTLPALLQDARRRRRVQTGFVDPAAYQFLEARNAQPPTALVTIQKGCDNACAYCIVPSVRGPCVSRPREEILTEVQSLVDGGVREVTLIGQNVNAFRGGQGGEDDFIELLRAVAAIEGLRRLRFTTSHPKDFHEAMPDCFRQLRALCPWLHLPVQSGSTRVLERMKRGYTRERYVTHIDNVRAHRPDIVVGTDIIVGFPGETEADFQETLSLVEEIQFDYAYSFKFSPRPGTAAAAQPDDVDEQEKRRRLHLLQTTQDGITARRLARFEGQVVEVLVEGASRKGPPQLSGRTPGNQVVNIDEGSGWNAGDLVQVQILRAGRHSLTGIPISGRTTTRKQTEVGQSCSSR